MLQTISCVSTKTPFSLLSYRGLTFLFFCPPKILVKHHFDSAHATKIQLYTL